MISAIQKIWVQISKVTTVTPTLLRKTMAMRYLDRTDQEQTSLARKMNHRRNAHNARYVLHNQMTTNQLLAPQLRDAMLGRWTAKKLTPAKVINLSPSTNEDTLTCEAAPSKDLEPVAPGPLITIGKSIFQFLTCNYLLLKPL